MKIKKLITSLLAAAVDFYVLICYTVNSIPHS